MTITRIVLMRILRSRRTLAIAMLPLLAVVIGLIMLSVETTREPYGQFTRGFIIPIVVALVALVTGASAVTDEREDLTILYVTQTVASRVRIVVESWFATYLATLALSSPAVLIAVLLARRAWVGVEGTLAMIAAVALAAAAYTAVATTLGYLTKRAIIVGIVYVLLWEGSIASFAQAANNLSIAAHARVVLAHGLDVWTRAEIDPPDTGAVTAVITLAAIAAVALAVGVRRLQRMNLP